jgi:peptidyl-prolyl cis-trans isomerase D
MQIGQIDYNSESEGGLTGYEAFRKAADSVTADSFPELVGLDDGGVFALRLDGIEPAALKPLDEVKDQVAADWTAAETQKRLSELAAEKLAELDNGATLESLGLVTTRYDDFGRGGFVADAAPEVGEKVFAMTAGESAVVDAGGKLYLLTLNAVAPADPANEAVKAQRDQAATAISQSIGRDVFEKFVRSLQTSAGIRLDSAAINAVNAQMR